MLFLSEPSFSTSRCVPVCVRARALCLCVYMYVCMHVCVFVSDPMAKLYDLNQLILMGVLLYC